MTTKPFYRLVERKPNPPYTDRLVFQNDHDHQDRVEFSEWWFRRLWRYSPGWLAYQAELEGPR
jgi:hypothetical protein